MFVRIARITAIFLIYTTAWFGSSPFLELRKQNPAIACCCFQHYVRVCYINFDVIVPLRLDTKENFIEELKGSKIFHEYIMKEHKGVSR